MGDLKGMQTILEDSTIVQGWPYVQHEFFPCAGFRDTSHLLEQMQDRLDGSSVAQQHLIQDNCAYNNGNANGSKHWRGSWNWDSLSFSAQCTTAPSTGEHSTNSLKSLKDCHLKLSSSVELNMPHSDSMSLALGLKNPSSEGDGLLDLKLGWKDYTFGGVEHTPSVKRSRHSPPETQHPRCQVDNCMADLKDAKDYHRRHKVCEVHAKALKAPVSRIMQRFCQQCSRFHSLQEFDEDRRSCRRRLAGHNRRRRKSQPDAVAALACLLADQNSLGRIVNYLHKIKERRSLKACLACSPVQMHFCVPFSRQQQPQTRDLMLWEVSTNDFVNAYAKSQVLNLLLSNPALVSKLESVVTNDLSVSALASALLQNLQQCSGKAGAGLHEDPVPCTNEDDANLANENVVDEQQHHNGLNCGHIPSSCSVLHQEHTLRHLSRSRISNVEVNEGGYLNESHSFRVEQGNAQLPVSNLNSQPELVAVHHRRSSCEYMVAERNIAEEGTESPTQGSGESSNSGLDKQEQTFQIWFKLFDRGPEDLPSTLRNQMLEWLDHHPSEMEGFIRPGCIILTVYVRLPMITWRNLCNNIERCLWKLANCDFWRNGHVVMQLGDARASIIEGNVVVNANPLSRQAPYLLLVRPFAVTIGETHNFIFKGYNLKADNTKVIFAYDGKSVEKDVSLLGACERKREREEGRMDNIKQVEALTFNMGPFNSTGHGFIEVEGQACRGNVFPFLVAEKPVCEEVNLLEEEIEKSFLEKSSAKSVKASKGIQFLYELGWLFERSKWKSSSGGVKIKEFSPERYRWLLCFAVDHDWCAVVKKILDILFGTDDECRDLHSYNKALEVLSDTHLLHVAVGKNSRSMVEELSAFSPPREWAGIDYHYIFRPDSPGPGGLTPLHIAASMHDAMGVLDALTNFPEELWASTWTSGKDDAGQTPLAYALLTANCAYIRLVQGKLQRIKASEEQARSNVKDERAHTSVTIVPTGDPKVLAPERALKSKFLPCRCSCQDLSTHSHGLPLKIYGLNGPVCRPFMLSMLAIAAVCVCVGLFMKGPPNVTCVRPPFVWEKIGFGFI